MIKKCTRSLYSGNFWVLSLLPFILYVRHWYHSNPPHTSQMGITWIANYSTTAAAAAKLPQSCPTLCNPIDGSPPASPSLGFSRQEHWSGLPLPSPIENGNNSTINYLLFNMNNILFNFFIIYNLDEKSHYNQSFVVFTAIFLWSTSAGYYYFMCFKTIPY